MWLQYTYVELIVHMRVRCVAACGCTSKSEHAMLLSTSIPYIPTNPYKFFITQQYSIPYSSIRSAIAKFMTFY